MYGSKADKLRNLDGSFLVYALARGYSCQTRHRAGTRIGQLHILRQRNLSEDQVTQSLVAAAVSAFVFWKRDLLALFKTRGDVHFRFLFDRPGLALIITYLKAAFLAVESNTITFKRH